MERGTFRRLSDRDFESFYAIWSPDGKKVVFHSNQHGGNGINLYLKSLDGSGPEKRLTPSDFNQQPKSWPRGTSDVIYQENIHTETGYDIYMVDTSDNSTPIPILKTNFNEAHPNVSPDGNGWLISLMNPEKTKYSFPHFLMEITEHKYQTPECDHSKNNEV